MPPRGVRTVITILKDLLRIFTCVRKATVPTSFGTDPRELTMLHDIHDLVPSGGFQEPPSMTRRWSPSMVQKWDLEPRGLSYEDVNSIRWIQTRCAESFASIDEGGMTVFMYGLFAKSANSLTLDIALFIFIPSLSRNELDEVWSRSALRRYESQTIEDHLVERIERDVVICCADDPYGPSKKVDKLKQDHVCESEETEISERGIIELYPKCPVVIDLPAWEDDLFK